MPLHQGKSVEYQCAIIVLLVIKVNYLMQSPIRLSPWNSGAGDTIIILISMEPSWESTMEQV